jgi:branched-chain amino acid transport system substrate-binding protein
MMAARFTVRYAQLVGRKTATPSYGVPSLTGPGVTDSEIKIGNCGPYSGPLSNGSPFPISQAAYFKMINDEGGINGRKITFISYDDGYSPPKTVEMTRKLVESKRSFPVPSAPRPTPPSGIT